MTAAILEELFGALALFAMERLPDGRFKLLVPAPSWVTELWPPGADADGILALAAASPFLENFLVDAEAYWPSREPGPLSAGEWCEVDGAGREHYLGATALRAAGRHVLLVKHFGAELPRPMALVRRGRETRLLQLEALAGLEAEKQAADAANRAKSDFLARMSHELRTPLNSVIGFAGVLLRKHRATLEAKDTTYLERILDNGRHLLALINDILDLSRIEAGRMPLDIAPVALDRLIAEVVGEIEAQVVGRELALRAVVPAEVKPFTTDARKLKQALINLLANALRFTARGSVSVRLIADPATLVATRIEVVDTGDGIPPERLEAVFEAFAQANATTARDFGGTGLGLTITRSLLEVLGHRITVTSQVGQGTTFVIHLAAPGLAFAAAEASARLSCDGL